MPGEAIFSSTFFLTLLFAKRTEEENNVINAKLNIHNSLSINAIKRCKTTLLFYFINIRQVFGDLTN